MEYILGMIWNYIEVGYYIILCKAFLQDRLTRKQSLIVYLVSSFMLFILLNTCSLQLLRQLLSYFYLLAMSFVLFRGSILWHVLISFVGYIFAGIFDTAILYGTCAIMGISFSDFVWKKLAYSAAVTIGKLLALLLAWILFKFRRQRNTQKIHAHWLILTLVFPSVSLLMLTVIFLSYQNSNDLSVGAFVLSIGLAIANVAILYLIQSMEVQTQKEHEMLLLNQQMEIQTNSILALEKSYRAQRQATHEFRHHLQTVSDLLARNDSKPAQEYLLQLLETQTNRVLCINSGHPIVDAVINQKYQVAKEYDIDMQIQVNDLSNISIETDALVVLLSNLLDNAIEACRRIEKERIIECRILADDGLLISVRNTSDPVVIIGNTIPTTKEPKADHGYGLPNTQHILDRMQAEYTFSYDEGWFYFVSEIPN